MQIFMPYSCRDIPVYFLTIRFTKTLKVWCWDLTYNINALNVAADIYREEHPNFTDITWED